MIHDVYLDTETTGLQSMIKGTETPGKHDVIQVAAIMEEKEFEEKCQPIRWDSVDQRALDVHGYQINDLKKFQHSSEACIKFRSFLAEQKKEFGDKFRMIAHNLPFDYKFVKAWFFKNGFMDWDEFFIPQEDCICTMKLGNKAKKAGLLPGIENMRLITAAAYIDYQFDAHDALGDTLACKKFHEYLMGGGQETEAGECTPEELAADGHTDEEEVEEVVEPTKGTGRMVL